MRTAKLKDHYPIRKIPAIPKTQAYWMYLLNMVGLNNYPKVEYSRNWILKDTKTIHNKETRT